MGALEALHLLECGAQALRSHEEVHWYVVHDQAV
jgi:hypothetical protein